MVTVQPGAAIQVQTAFAMPSGMGGPHEFVWTVVSDASGEAAKLTVKAEYPTP